MTAQTITNGMRPIHPCEVLREEILAPLATSAHALALRLRVPAPRINDLVRERRGISTALRLARFFNTTPEFWLNLQIAFDLKTTRQQKAAEIEQDINPLAA